MRGRGRGSPETVNPGAYVACENNGRYPVLASEDRSFGQRVRRSSSSCSVRTVTIWLAMPFSGRGSKTSRSPASHIKASSRSATVGRRANIGSIFPSSRSPRIAFTSSCVAGLSALPLAVGEFGLASSDRCWRHSCAIRDLQSEAQVGKGYDRRNDSGLM